MKSLKALVSLANAEILDEREKAAVAALKAAIRRADEANAALEKLKQSIEDGSFVPCVLSGSGWTVSV